MNEHTTIVEKYSYVRVLWHAQHQLCIVLIVACAFLQCAFGQIQNVVEREKHAWIKSQKVKESAASSWFDVTYYLLDLTITTQPNYLKGKVTIVGTCLQNNSQILTLDLLNTMFVDSVQVNGKRNLVLQNSSSIVITLDHLYQSGEMLSINIYYQGTPVASGFGSFVFDGHSGVPWVYTLSEPFGAGDWWPCKNTPSDKADSADIIVTCNSIFKVGSQGSLVSVVTNGDGTVTFHWKERYPIASYLISIAMTDYKQFSNWFRYSPSDSMEILNYVLPEHYSIAVAILPRTVDMLSIFSNMFGMYPFIKEKYGHAEFASGGMEHQTMTSLGTFNEDVIAHELAHQWFGDMITCRSWSDLWLNEGFAQYSTALYREKKYGVSSYRDYMNVQQQRAMFAEGKIGAPDTTSPNKLFSSALIYSKGASVLHMLRHVLGDSLFFRSLYEYANDPLLKYSNAVTKDFQNVCERVSNRNLDYYFQEWIYGENVPSYEYSWGWRSMSDSSILTITLRQPTGRTNPKYFTMPLDFRITGPGLDTTVTVFNNTITQTFSLRISKKPTAVVIDPDGWVLKRVFSGMDGLPTGYVLEQNFPNPFNASTTIRYMLSGSAHVSLNIYDVLGRTIATIVDAQQFPGAYEYQWIPQSSASGVYFYRLMAGGAAVQKKMVLLR